MTMECLIDWTQQVRRLWKAAKTLIIVGHRTQNIVDQIQVRLVNVCMAVDDLIDDYDSLLNDKLRELIAENSPAALVALELQKLTKQDQAHLKLRIVKMYQTYDEIQDIYAVINYKANVLRNFCTDYIIHLDIVIRFPDTEGPSVLTLENPALPFEVLSPRLRTMIEYTKATYVSLLTDLRESEENMDNTVQNLTARIFKSGVMKARSYTNLAIYAYEKELEIFDALQEVIYHYQEIKLDSLERVGSILPTLEALTLAFEVLQTKASTGH